jgi:predicted O-methyltransferase YrrM
MNITEYLNSKGFHAFEGNSQQVQPQVEDLIQLSSKPNIRVMEIGFNSGFSTLLMLLSNPNIHISCFDLGEHRYTMKCYEKLKETFGERINIVLGDSTKTLLNIHDKFDLIHIDGGHSTEVAESDIINSYRLSKSGTILIMDDYDFPNLHELWNNYIIQFLRIILKIFLK